MAVWAVFVLAHVATWWIVGDLSDVAPEQRRLYFVRPLPISTMLETTLGLTSMIGIFVVAITVRTAVTRLELPNQWLTLLYYLFSCGVVTGFGARVLTVAAPDSPGAIIWAAPLPVLLAAPVVAIAVLGGLARSWKLLRPVLRRRIGSHWPALLIVLVACAAASGWATQTLTAEGLGLLAIAPALIVLTAMLGMTVPLTLPTVCQSEVADSDNPASPAA